MSRAGTARAIPWLYAVAGGVVWWASQPPLGWWAAVLLVVPLHLLALDAADAAEESPAGVGAAFGAVAFGPMLWWLATSLAGPLGWVLLVGVQAAWLALASALIVRVLDRRWRYVLVPVVWVGVEAWRAVVPLGGFDWGALGYAHAQGSPMLLSARVLGVRWLTLLTVVIGVALFEAVRAARAEGDPATRLGRARTGLLVAVAGFAAGILVVVEPPATTGEVLDVLVVQGNGGGFDDLSGLALDEAIAAQHRDLTLDAVASDDPDLTVWPESAVDRDPDRSDAELLAEAVAETLAGTGGALMYGTDLEAGPTAFRRVSRLVRPDGDVVEYDKWKLVPFGEFVPWRDVLGEIPPLPSTTPRDALPGPGGSALPLSGTELAVAICFETLFPEVVRANVLAAGPAGAGLLVATTNDHAFGDTAAPVQHLLQTQLRAVETGRHAAHASISGPSAFVDPDGQVRERTEVFTAGTVRAEVPVVSGTTPFLAVGDVVSDAARLGVVAVALGLLLVRLRRTR